MKHITCFVCLGVLAGSATAAFGGTPALGQSSAAAPTAIAPSAVAPAVNSATAPQMAPAGAVGQFGAPYRNGQFGGSLNAQGVGPNNFGGAPEMNGMNGMNGTGNRFGNAPYGTPLGNLQYQTQGNPTAGPGLGSYGNGGYSNGGFGSVGPGGPNIGGVNGAGSVVGGFQSGGLQQFQNGAFEVGGFNRGIGTSGGAYPGPTAYGTDAPSIYGTSNNIPGSYGANYGYNPAPGVIGGYNPVPPVGNEQSAAEGRFQYGWW